LFTRLLSKNVKIYKTIIILHVLLYGYGTCSLTLREENLFENSVLRRIFGPKKEKAEESCTMNT
jgi:hypothetical protein